MALQIVLIVLLLVAIGWNALLHRRLAALRQGGGGLAQFVGDLVGATARAEAGIRELRAAAAELARQWREQRGQGDAAAAELRRLLQDAQAAARELRHAASIQPAAPVGERDGAGRRTGDAGRERAAAAPPAPDPSPHERIRRAIQDLR
jgi:hypothetical protein